MNHRVCKSFVVFACLASSALWGQATESSITQQLQSLGALPPSKMVPGGPPMAKTKPTPDTERPAAVLQLSKDISSLPAGPGKVKFADTLMHAATDGQSGAEAVQAAADTLSKALAESPQTPGKDGLPPQPYMDLAKLVRYAGSKVTLSDPLFTKAGEILAANEADVAKADFTMKDVNGKKWTLSALNGKIVLVDFWTGTCMNCRKEMQDLDLIYTHYQSQGLVILSVVTPTPDDILDLNHFLTYLTYHPPVLLDDGGKVGKAFHIDGLPRTFVFDRDGKLSGESIGMCTQRQFFAMLGKAGLHP